MAEADYERSLNIIREEVFAATDAFYTMMEINQFAFQEPSQLRRLPGPPPVVTRG
jgi:hypothetical protein